MASDPGSLTIKLIVDAGVFIMAAWGSGLKKLAPPEVPALWVVLGTIAASCSYATAWLLVRIGKLPVDRDDWLIAAVLSCWLAVGLGLFSLLTHFARTVRFDGRTLLAGTDSEYQPTVAADPQNTGKTREALIFDAA